MYKSPIAHNYRGYFLKSLYMTCITGYISPDKKIKIILAEPMDSIDAIKTIGKMLGATEDETSEKLFSGINGEVRQMQVSCDYKYDLRLVSEFDGMQ